MLLQLGAALALAATTSSTSTTAALAASSRATLINQTSEAIKSLNNRFYSQQTGVYDDAWWNSANAITTMADFAAIDLAAANAINVGGYLRNTFVQAQKTDVRTVKAMKNGRVSSTYCLDNRGGCMAKREFAKRGFDDFINEFYDDEGWWALAWIRAYDVSGDRQYLEAAASLFKDMQTGTGTPCGGGIFWNKQRKYVNSIANQLYLAVAASLANRMPKQPVDYLSLARAQWTWFEKSGMINKNGLVNDGLDGSCKNNGLPTWTYNQGVIIGALVEMSRASGERWLVDRASAFADAALSSPLKGKDGILHEVDNCETKPGNCGKDGQQFKGIFIRNLRYLYLAQQKPNPKYRDFILRNARSIWDKDRAAGASLLGPAWAGPYIAATGPSQSSALDALVAAVAVA
ncbi:hypothetical protein L249_8050 [Ophiocordyceps polyrhachis-furcata BCC 54312]|uniref:Mannan endo-1,6-alpha-mannosidase n=1 Tax=Ophiocordyceps polyrhachis-furcata BCC 54312 TaxID=1330021 RepID=A0A367LI11_9HYPO|nr:hypothetical protein L249_8050 [Ophiocordyceps polyrhachis-furcata BCC 54312]